MMAGWCQIHHSGHAWPHLHDPPHRCDFPDVEALRGVDSLDDYSRGQAKPAEKNG
jgi:hypothetical protein